MADPDLVLGKGGKGTFSVACPAGFSSFAIPFFFFLTVNKEGGSGLGSQGLSPRSATALTRVGLIAAYLLF